MAEWKLRFRHQDAPGLTTALVCSPRPSTLVLVESTAHRTVRARELVFGGNPRRSAPVPGGLRQVLAGGSVAHVLTDEGIHELDLASLEWATSAPLPKGCFAPRLVQRPDGSVEIVSGGSLTVTALPDQPTGEQALGVDAGSRRVVFVPSPNGRKKERLELRADDQSIAGLTLPRQPGSYLMRAFLLPSVFVAFRPGLYAVDLLTVATWDGVDLGEPQIADAQIKLST